MQKFITKLMTLLAVVTLMVVPAMAITTTDYSPSADLSGLTPTDTMASKTGTVKDFALAEASAVIKTPNSASTAMVALTNLRAPQETAQAVTSVVAKTPNSVSASMTNKMTASSMATINAVLHGLEDFALAEVNAVAKIPTNLRCLTC